MNQSLILISLFLLMALVAVLWFSQFKMVYEDYSSGELHRKYKLKNGRKEGKEYIYYRTGELNKVKEWRKGELSGQVITYYKSGEKYIIDTYAKGEYLDSVILNTALSHN